jgi:hypothetical protein
MNEVRLHLSEVNDNRLHQAGTGETKSTSDKKTE